MTNSTQDTERLNEFDKTEFEDATRKLWPKGYTEADFERDWQELQRLKAARAMQNDPRY